KSLLHQIFAYKTVDFHFRRTLSAGNVSASGQHDVGHEGVATGRCDLSLRSLTCPVGSSLGTAFTRPTKKTCCFPAGVAALRSQLDLLTTYSSSVASANTATRPCTTQAIVRFHRPQVL